MSQSKKAVVLYSGGTDSTCVAALLSERMEEIHLLTFYELGTRNSPSPVSNVEKLRGRFPNVHFVHHLISTDKLVRAISYDRYFYRLRKHGLFALATPGYSTLSWHLRCIIYAKEQGISYVADGQTRELMHFPGHMDEVIQEFKGLYARFGITYENPVRDWDVPRDQQFLDRLLVGRHGYVQADDGELVQTQKTTGNYLYQIGITPHRNVKGSAYDRIMQHDCYPFVLYNLFAFWHFIPMHSEEKFRQRTHQLFAELTERFGNMLESYLSNTGNAAFSRWVESTSPKR